MKNKFFVMIAMTLKSAMVATQIELACKLLFKF